MNVSNYYFIIIACLLFNCNHAIKTTYEEKNGFPAQLLELSEYMKNFDGYVVSLAEHNGSYAAAFKSILDWLSRINREIFNNKPVLLLATSPGGRGGVSVLGAASDYFPHAGASEVVTFSLPYFYDNFQENKKGHGIGGTY